MILLVVIIFRSGRERLLRLERKNFLSLRSSGVTDCFGMRGRFSEATRPGNFYGQAEKIVF